jgi:hypothetical protein
MFMNLLKIEAVFADCGTGVSEMARWHAQYQPSPGLRNPENFVNMVFFFRSQPWG